MKKLGDWVRTREPVGVRARGSALQELVEATAQATTPAEIACSTVDIAGKLLGADGAAVYTQTIEHRSDGALATPAHDGSAVLAVLHAAGWAQLTMERYQQVTVRQGRPLSDAFLTGSAVWIEDADDWYRRYPEMAQAGTSEGSQATACLPLRAGGRDLGVVVFSFSRPRRFHAEERGYLLAVAALCAQALDRHRVRAAEQASRVAVGLQLDRMSFLVRANQMMDAPLSVEQRLQRLADLAVPQVADWCAVHLVRNGRVDQVAVAHSDPEKVAFVARLEAQYPPDPDADGGAVAVSRTGVPAFVPDVTDELLVLAAVDATHLELIREIGMRSYMVVPLLVRGRSLGSVTLVQAESGRRFVDTDLTFVTQLASTAAVALDNARLYEQQRQVAQTLQSALLPDVLPVVPGLDVSARYHPQSADLTDFFVGGDVYDIVDGGGPTATSASWSAMVGDVCGKGADAAAVTALIRHTWRAAISHGLRPREVLSSINQAMLRRHGADRYRFATLAHARVLVDGGGATVTLVNGGHLPPLLLRGSRVETIDLPGALVGVFPDLALPELDVRLSPGDALVLYTDGVTEARGPDGFYGSDRLISVLAACAGRSVDDIADAILDDVLRFQVGQARDDIALLVMQAEP